MADDNERLVGLLKFQPREFMDDVINAVHDYVCDGMDGLEEALTANLPKKYTKNASHKECLRKGVEEVFQRFQSSVDRNYDKFDLYVTKNVLNQPEDIVFPNEDRSNPVVSEADANDVDQEIEELCQEVAQARTLNRRLKREVSALEVDFQSMEALEPAFEGVSSEYKRRKVEHVLTKVTQSATELLNVGRQLGMKCNSDGKQANLISASANPRDVERRFAGFQKGMSTCSANDLGMFAEQLGPLGSEQNTTV